MKNFYEICVWGKSYLEDAKREKNGESFTLTYDKRREDFYCDKCSELSGIPNLNCNNRCLIEKISKAA